MVSGMTCFDMFAEDCVGICRLGKATQYHFRCYMKFYHAKNGRQVVNQNAMYLEQYKTLCHMCAEPKMLGITAAKPDWILR